MRSENSIIYDEDRAVFDSIMTTKDLEDPERYVLERKVAGEYNTFRVYLHLMKVRKATARGVYKALGMSSTSLALLHLEKLDKLGLVQKNRYGTYHITSSKRFGTLRLFYLIGKWFVPRTFFYFLFFTSMTIARARATCGD